MVIRSVKPRQDFPMGVQNTNGDEDEGNSHRPPSMNKLKQWALRDGKEAQQNVTAHARCCKCRNIYPMSNIRILTEWGREDVMICTFCVKENK